MFARVQDLPFEHVLFLKTSYLTQRSKGKKKAYHSRIERRIRAPTSQARTEHNMVHRKLPLLFLLYTSLTLENSDVPLAGFLVLYDVGNVGRGPHVQLERVGV